MDWILLAYVAVNMFIAGYYCADKVPYADSEDEKFGTWSAIIVLAFAGIIIITPVILYNAIIKAIKMVDSFFQIRFWWGFYLKKKYHNMTPDMLAQYNRWGAQKGRRTLNGKLFNLCIDKINERNNYTYKEPEPNF